MSQYTVKVEGLRELDRAFASVSKDVRKEFRQELRKAAEPVRERSEALAIATISNMGAGPWSRMRLGTLATGAYVAPRSRRRGGSPRPNLGPLLLRAMLSAADEKRSEVEGQIEQMMDRIVLTHGLG